MEGHLARKFAALERRMELRVLASAPAGASRGDGTFQLVPPLSPRALDGALYYLTLPVRIARALRGFRPDAVHAESVYEGFAALVGRALARRRVPVVLDVHGDWRTPTRLYGSPLRALLNPLADRVSAAAVRRADAVRTLSPFTTGLVRACGVEPAAVFPAYTDFTTFLERPPAPLPERPSLLFVGVLERYKNVDGLAAAWRLAAPRLPEATLRIVGDGTETALVERLVAELPERTRWERRLTQPEVRDALDAASALLLPSRSEGLPRIAMEALCRGRPVLGSREGGIPDLVEDGANGVLVDAADPEELAGAIVRTLSDRGLLERLAAGAAASAARWVLSPDEYAERLLALVSVERR